MAYDDDVQYSLQTTDDEYKQQDQHLDEIGSSLDRLKHVLIDIGQEVTSQHEIIDDLNTRASSTSDRLREGSRAIDSYLAEDEENNCQYIGVIICMVITIWILWLTLCYL
jgi:t-SNARE complex subunit (syntaxin)